MLDGIGVDAVVDFRQFPLCVPAYLCLFLLFQPLELFYQIELERNADGSAKLESDVFIGVCTAIPSFPDHDANGIGAIYPFGCTQDETWQTCLLSKVVKFDHFKAGIVNHLPRTQELDSISVADPILDDISGTAVAFFGTCHVCQRYIVVVIIIKYGYLRVQIDT